MNPDEMNAAAAEHRKEAKATPGNFVRWFDGAWSLGLTYDSPPDHWGFSACLWPRGRSSNRSDWELLGQWSRAVGVPEGCECLGNTIETQASAIHKWYWLIEGRAQRGQVVDTLESLRQEIKTGRNDPCPCGSGKKYKKCCIDKPLESYGPCEARVGPFGREVDCGAPSRGVLECKFCIESTPRDKVKVYPYCPSHGSIVSIMLEGHILRTHPEKVPVAMQAIAKNPTQLASLRARAAQAPDLWGRQLAEVEKYVVPS